MKQKRMRRTKMRVSILIGLIVALIIFSGGIVCAESIINIPVPTIGLVTKDLNQGVTSTSIVNNLLGGGVTVSNIKFTGANVSAGTFSGGNGIIGFNSGIILSSGDIKNVIGPNIQDGITASNGKLGDLDLDKLIPGYKTNDASVLEFDFVPITNQLQFKYVFSSDEYNEYVGSSYNDVFGFFVNGKNIALIPGTTTPVSINNINCGNPFNCKEGNNSGYYINNDISDGGGSINTEMDGLTTVLTATASVTSGQTNHIKLVVADAGDYVLDSNVFIEAGSFESPQLKLEPATAINNIGTSHTLTATLVDGGGKPISGQIITFNITEGVHKGMSGSGTTSTDGIATWSYVGTTVGNDTIVATGYDQISIPVYKTWEQATLPSIKLIPATATNIVGTSHIVTATYFDGSGSPIPSQKITFTVTAGPHVGMSGNDTTDLAGIATWSYIGTNIGTDTINAVSYDQSGNPWVTSNDVQKIWKQSTLSIVNLSPATATNPVNTEHTVTATVKDVSGSSQSGATVNFSLISGPNAPLAGSGVTNTNGEVTFTYAGNGGIGIDKIQASVIINSNTLLSNIVEKEWISSGDIIAYYRGLNQFPDIIETNDLLKGADDWRDSIAPPGFSVSLTTPQLLALADEWRVS